VCSFFGPPRIVCCCVVFLLQIIKISLEYIVYDPNYNYDDEHDENNMETDDDEEAEYVSCLLLGIPRPTQPFTLGRMGKEYQPKVDDALLLAGE